MIKLIDKKYRITRDSVIIFVVSLLLFSLSTIQQAYYQGESSLILFAQDITNNGFHFFPMIDGALFPDQPGTISSILYLSYSPLGSISRFNAIFPSALCSALSLVLIYLIAAPQSRKWGFCSVLFALSTLSFTLAARSASSQPYLMLITTLCFYLVYAKDLYVFSTHLGWLVLLCAIGFICCGPIGFVLPALVTGSYYLLARRWQDFSVFIVIAALFFVVLSWVYLHLAYVSGGQAFVQQILSASLMGNLIYSTQHSIGYYCLYSLSWYALSYPVAIIVLLGSLPKLFILQYDKRIKLLQCLAVWMIIVLVVFSLQPYKNIGSVLPLVPACALIAGYLFIDEEQVIWLAALRRVFAFLLFVMPFIAAASCLIAKNIAKHRLHENFHAQYIYLLIILALLQLVAIIYGLARHSSRKESMGLLVATLSFMAVFILVAEPALLLKTSL